MTELTVKKVEWAGHYPGKVKPKPAFDAMEKIKAKNGGSLTASALLDGAKSNRNVLHKAFEWDDAVAGHEYRLTQARTMIRSIKVVYAEKPNSSIRVYETVTEAPTKDYPERKVYKSQPEILADPVLRDEMLGNAIADIVRYRRKYAELSELAVVFAAIDDMMINQKIA